MARKQPKTATPKPEPVDPAGQQIVGVLEIDTGRAWFTTAEAAQKMIERGTHKASDGE